MVVSIVQTHLAVAGVPVEQVLMPLALLVAMVERDRHRLFLALQ
jgi:hypothetical protein